MSDHVGPENQSSRRHCDRLRVCTRTHARRGVRVLPLAKPRHQRIVLSEEFSRVPPRHCKRTDREKLLARRKLQERVLGGKGDGGRGAARRCRWPARRNAAPQNGCQLEARREYARTYGRRWCPRRCCRCRSRNRVCHRCQC
ncbi:hypothetical protein PUN28_013028 [Cardiocondyla obscurior]|uniref:Uncharacterized protein n=1 Tax=Cardiocondyla obscurior TaxID=286306 RepID=A0AAW2FC69_9HYME